MHNACKQYLNSYSFLVIRFWIIQKYSGKNVFPKKYLLKYKVNLRNKIIVKRFLFYFLYMKQIR